VDDALADLVYSLNDVDDHSQRLAEALERILDGHKVARETHIALRAVVSDLRLALDRAGAEAGAAREGLIEIADRCYASDEDRSPWLCECLASAFGRMGLKLVGLPGQVVDDLSEVEVVSTEERPEGKANSVVHTACVGLRHEDGHVVRLARVVVATGGGSVSPTEGTDT